ncbi:hypothetical protein Hanom_Chr14g01330861 [Helianthus anomalus]
MNITGTLNKDVLLKNYKGAVENIKKLKDLGARVLHEVDARNMSTNRHFRSHTYDLIIYNFPHSGFKYNDSNGKATRYELISRYLYICYCYS